MTHYWIDAPTNQIAPCGCGEPFCPWAEYTTEQLAVEEIQHYWARRIADAKAELRRAEEGWKKAIRLTGVTEICA